MKDADNKLMYTTNYVKEERLKVIPTMYTFFNTKNRATIDLSKVSYYAMDPYVDHSDKHSYPGVLLIVDSEIRKLEFYDSNGAIETICMLDDIYAPIRLLGLGTGTSSPKSSNPTESNYQKEHIDDKIH